MKKSENNLKTTNLTENSIARFKFPALYKEIPLLCNSSKVTSLLRELSFKIIHVVKKLNFKAKYRNKTNKNGIISSRSS